MEEDFQERRRALLECRVARALPVLVVLLGCAAWLAGLLSAGFLLTNDGPSHLLQCHVFAGVDEPGSRWQGLFTANTPVTARGSCELLLALGAFLPWRAAHQVVLGLPSVLFALAALLAARAIDPRRAWAALVVVGLSGHTLAYYGLLPYALGAGLAALGLAVLVAAAAAGQLAAGRTALMFGALFALVALCHAVAAGLLGLLAVAALMGGMGPGELRRVALRYLLASLPAGLLLLRSLGYTEDNLGPAPTEWLDLGLRAHVFLGWAQVGGRPHELVAVPLPSAGVAFGAMRARSLGPAERSLLVMVLAALLLYWLLPQNALGFRIFAPRALVFFVVFGVVALPLEAVPGPRALLPAVLSILCALNLAWLWRFHDERARAADQTLALLEVPVRAPGVRLPVLLDPYLGRPNGMAWGIYGWVPGLHAAQLYALTQGGAVEYSQDRRAATQWALRTPESHRGEPPVLRRYFPRLDAQGRERRALAAARAGGAWDGVIVLGRADEQQVFLERGYVADAQNPSVLLARFVGCALDVGVHGVPRDAELVVEVRATGDSDPWRTAQLSGGEDPEALVHLRPGSVRGAGPAAPCGLVTVTLRAPWTCAEGPLTVESGAGARVDCAVTRAP